MRRAVRTAPDVAQAGDASRVAGGVAVVTETEAAAMPGTGPATTRALIWRLQSGGWSSVEAGNLAAIALGLRPARTGWTGSQLDHLRFLRSLVHAGRIEL